MRNHGWWRAIWLPLIPVLMLGGALATSAPRSSLAQDVARASATDCSIDQVYRDLLGRPADSVAFTAFEPLTPAQIAQAVVGSQEYRSVLIQGLYAKLLNRTASPLDVNGFLLVLQSGGTDEDVISAIVGSNEYFALAGGTLNDFITKLYQDLLGRTPGPSEIASWQSFSQTQIAQAVIASQEYRTALVQREYLRLLRRPADGKGLAFYAGELQGGLMTDEQLIVALVSSLEYQLLPCPGPTPTSTPTATGTTTPTTTATATTTAGPCFSHGCGTTVAATATLVPPTVTSTATTTSTPNPSNTATPCVSQNRGQVC